MSEDAVRRALADLASPKRAESSNERPPLSEDRGPTFRETIERASAAVDDVEAAAQFVEEVGLNKLEEAVERAERSVSACADDGRRALAVFREFRDAADGGCANGARGSSGEHSSPGDHFHPGHGTSLGGGDIGPSK